MPGKIHKEIWPPSCTVTPKYGTFKYARSTFVTPQYVSLKAGKNQVRNSASPCTVTQPSINQTVKISLIQKCKFYPNRHNKSPTTRLGFTKQDMHNFIEHHM